MSNEIVKKFKELHKRLKQLRTDIRSLNTKTVHRKEIRNKAEKLGVSWFNNFVPHLSNEALLPNIIERYSAQFQRLIKLSAPSNLRKSYEEVLQALCRSFREDLILPLQQRPSGTLTLNQLGSMLANLPNPVQNEYLKEAVACARYGYSRAAAVLGWSAAIDQIHQVIKKNGFNTFNATSVTMTNQKTGRFKKFNQVQNISSISELRQIFDTIVLWILEGMQLIDSNEHTRLLGCFYLRCQCSHPGDAPVTEYNLLSFFSDLNQIVFRNSRFSV